MILSYFLVHLSQIILTLVSHTYLYLYMLTFNFHLSFGITVFSKVFTSIV